MDRFASCVIPDALLDQYLEGKLLTKPDYGYPTTKDDSDVVSRYAAAREDEELFRKGNNKKTTFNYGLKK
jgi:hypothetical protein